MLKQKIHNILEHNEYFNFALVTLIILNVFAITLESISHIKDSYGVLFEWFEKITIVLFTVEYVLRVWSCHERKRVFVFRPLSIIDILSILPFYIELFIHASLLDLRFLRIVRLFRFLRVLKIARYSESLRLFGRVLVRSREQLVIAFLAIFIVLIISSVLVYFAECDEVGTKFVTIPDSLWWGVATLTTVGYGDIYPTTLTGRFIGSIIAVMSVGLIALPSGIIAASFIEELKARHLKCPHCGKILGG